LEILFPNGEGVELTSWNSIQKQTAHWLIANNMLDAPVPGAQPGKLLVNTEPFHSDGSHFPEYVEVNGLFISMGMDTQDVINRTKRIIRHVDQDPAQFKVRFPV
jgi:hypothetical protein